MLSRVPSRQARTGGRSTACLPWLAAIGLLACLLGWSDRVQGRQEYTLTDEDIWKQAKGAEPGTPEFQLMEGRKALALNEPERAENIATQWIKRHERNPLLPQAYLIRGDALVAQGDEYDALFDYEFIARMYPGSETFIMALQREFDIAKQYAAGLKRKLWGLRIADADDEAEEIFIRIQERMPGSRLAEDAGMHLADFYFDRRRMRMAVDAYTLFLENYPRSDRVDKARRRLIYSYLASFKGPEYDASGLYEARARLRELKSTQPAEADRIGADALIIRIDESDALKMLDTAQWYLRVGNPIAAERTIRRLVKRYPKSVATVDALELIPKILPQLPARILAVAPDYAKLRTEILGVPPKAGAAASPASAPTSSAASAPDQAPSAEGDSAP